MDIARLNLASVATAERILAIQQAAYRIEAELIGFADIPPLFDTIAMLQDCGEAFYGGRVEGTIAGFVSVEVKDDTVDICRMGVHPDYFRRGIAALLLRYLEVTAYPGLPRFTVSTGAKNTPARRLYEGHGFRLLHEAQVEPELVMAFYEKKRD